MGLNQGEPDEPNNYPRNEQSDKGVRIAVWSVAQRSDKYPERATVVSAANDADNYEVSSGEHMEDIINNNIIYIIHAYIFIMEPNIIPLKIYIILYR